MVAPDYSVAVCTKHTKESRVITMHGNLALAVVACCAIRATAFVLGQRDRLAIDSATARGSQPPGWNGVNVALLACSRALVRLC